MSFLNPFTVDPNVLVIDSMNPPKDLHINASDLVDVSFHSFHFISF